MTQEQQRLVDEIRDFFNNDFAIVLTNLQKPTYVFVRDFYARALIEFGADTDNVLKASHLLEGMDTSVEIAGDLNLVSAINYTFKFLNFGLFDLLSPGDNTKRTVSMISAVMRFLSTADELTSKLDFEAYRNFREEVIHQADKAEAMRQKLSEIALSKEQAVQVKISLKHELEKMKTQEQQLCSEVDAALKEANAAKMKFEERREIVKARLAEAEKLKSAINCLKDELIGAQTLGLKEAERNKVEQEKSELETKYMEKVVARKEYATALEAIKPFAAVADGVYESFDKVRAQQEELSSIQKETADMTQTLSLKNKELSGLDSAAVGLEKKVEKLKSDGTSFKEESTKKIDNITKKSSELAESIRITKEEITVNEENLDSLNKELDRDRMMLKEYVNKLNNEMEKRGGSHQSLKKW